MKKSWGVRRENLSQSQLQRTNNPTEEKIAKEIRELKEREEELVRAREMKDRSDSRSEQDEEEEEEKKEEEEGPPSLEMEEEKTVRPAVSLTVQPQPARQEERSRR